jgi:hypothetical protein
MKAEFLKAAHKELTAQWDLKPRRTVLKVPSSLPTIRVVSTIVSHVLAATTAMLRGSETCWRSAQSTSVRLVIIVHPVTKLNLFLVSQGPSLILRQRTLTPIHQH